MGSASQRGMAEKCQHCTDNSDLYTRDQRSDHYKKGLRSRRQVCRILMLQCWYSWRILAKIFLQRALIGKSKEARQGRGLMPESISSLSCFSLSKLRVSQEQKVPI